MATAFPCPMPPVGFDLMNEHVAAPSMLNGRLGVLVDPGNVDEISMALMQVLSKRHPLQILKQPDALRSGVINAYGYKRFVERVREIIQPFVD